MVLAFHGQQREEAEIASLLGTEWWVGASLPDLSRLEEWGYPITVDSGSFEELAGWLEEGVPPIVVMDASYLSRWSGHGPLHAVVVVGLEGSIVACHDPLWNDGPQSINRQEFRAAWSAADFQMVVIEPPSAL
jgi:hypothetical protein